MRTVAIIGCVGFVLFVPELRRQTQSVTAAPTSQTSDIERALEEVYVFRSVSSAVFGSTAKDLGPCARAPFAATAYDLQDLFSVDTSKDSGRVTDAQVMKIGTLAACLAPAPGTPNTLRLYAEGYFARDLPHDTGRAGASGRLSFINNGTCELEPGVPAASTTFLKCFTTASGLPENYVGGQTISSVLRGPGYLSTFGVARFFKRPSA